MSDIPDMRVLQSYSARAAEYTAILGSIDDMHLLDKTRIEQWGGRIGGSILDAGCGPGHWTHHLHQRGVDISILEFLQPSQLGTGRRSVRTAERFPIFDQPPAQSISANAIGLGNVDNGLGRAEDFTVGVVFEFPGKGST